MSDSAAESSSERSGPDLWTSARGTRLADTCLPVLLPAGTTLLHCHDHETASRLGEARFRDRYPGARVEIGSGAQISGAFDGAVVMLGAEARSVERRSKGPRRWMDRLQEYGVLRLKVLRETRHLRRVGYQHIDVILWDKGRRLRLPRNAERPPAGPAARLPRRAAIRGVHERPPATVLDRVLEEAGHITGYRLTGNVLLARSGVLVILEDQHVLRVALGPGARRIDNQADALVRLERSRLSPATKDLLPRVSAEQRTGLAWWALETRAPGRPASTPLSRGLQDDCVNFLVELFASEAQLEPASPLSSSTQRLAAVLPTTMGEMLRGVMARASERLSEVPRGVSHGDFFHGNLLVSNDHLSGVVDWDSARAGDLPLIDLFQLLATTTHLRGARWWGQVVIEFLLPEARRGGGPLVRDYCDRLDLDPEPALLEALVVAYWMQRLSYQVHGYADRTQRPVWLRRNVQDVLEVLALRG